MEFPELGKQCNKKFCSQLDFLPIACQHCKLSFCKDHVLPHIHACTEFTNSIKNEESSTEKIRYNCQYQQCKKWELTPVTCSACSLIFCLDHRHQVDHACKNYVAPVNHMAEAAEKLQKITNQMADKPKKKVNKKHDKTAAKVSIYKLKNFYSVGI